MIQGSTTIAGIFGNPIHRSLSPAMHNAAFAAQKLDWVYVPFDVRIEDVEAAVTALRALSIKGVNITMPLKSAVIPFLDEVRSPAAEIESVNTILNDNGRLIGFSTDGHGFIRSLADRGVEPGGKDVVLVGAGGAARAVKHALEEASASRVTIVNRTNIEGAIAFGSAATEAVGSADIIVNATPLGGSTLDDLHFLVDGLKAGQIVYDLSTVPPLSALLVAARSRGCTVINGLGMLVHQGALSYKLWTGMTPPLDVMRKAVGYGSSEGEG